MSLIYEALVDIEQTTFVEQGVYKEDIVIRKGEQVTLKKAVDRAVLLEKEDGKTVHLFSDILLTCFKKIL